MENNPLFKAITAALVERDDAVAVVLIGLYANEHVLFVGPPGTAKSYMLRLVAQAIEGLKFFEIGMSPTTDNDDLFGPPDFVEMRSTGRYVRRDDNYFGSAHLALLDEFFRANGAIQDRLLHGMGPERQVPIDGVQTKLPLLAAVGATNTWPDSSDQAAIFDRWLFRRTIRKVSPQGRSKLRRDGHNLPKVTPVMTVDDLRAGHIAAMSLDITPEAFKALEDIDEALKAEGIEPSDRRWTLSMKAIRAAALLAGASEVQPVHLECLADVLWDEPNEQPEKAAAIVTQIANPVGAKISELLRDVDTTVSDAVDDVKQAAAVKKLSALVDDAKVLAVGGNGRAQKCLRYVSTELARMRCRVAGMDPNLVPEAV